MVPSSLIDLSLEAEPTSLMVLQVPYSEACLFLCHCTLERNAIIRLHFDAAIVLKQRS